MNFGPKPWMIVRLSNRAIESSLGIDRVPHLVMDRLKSIAGIHSSGEIYD